MKDEVKAKLAIGATVPLAFRARFRGIRFSESAVQGRLDLTKR